MKRNVAKELETLIKSFNVKNDENDGLNNHLSYVCKIERFARGSYAAVIEYSCFFSSDLEKLMKFANTNNLCLWLGAYPREYDRSGRINIQ